MIKILVLEVSFSFQEFLKLTDFAESGSAKDKLLWAFRIYDKDRSGEERQGELLSSNQLISGSISVKEMVEMLGTVYTLEGFNKVWELKLEHQVSLSVLVRGS